MMGSAMFEYTIEEIIFCILATFQIFYFLILCLEGYITTNFVGVRSADRKWKDFDVNFWRVVSDACSATWNLSPNFAFILVLKESSINLNYITSNFLPQRKQRL
jgi:hypothetical protein